VSRLNTPNLKQSESAKTPLSSWSHKILVSILQRQKFRERIPGSNS